MNTQDYIKKYKLQNGFRSKSQVEFCEDMNAEFVKVFNSTSAVNDSKKFVNTVNQIRAKWDAISNKIPFGIPDKLWGFFYATKLAPFRDNLIKS